MIGQFGEAYLEALEEVRPASFHRLSQSQRQRLGESVQNEAMEHFQSQLSHLKEQHPLPDDPSERQQMLDNLGAQAREIVMNSILPREPQEESETANV